MVDKLVVVTMVFLLAGCYTVPEQIKIFKKHQLVNFIDVSDKSVGETVRWGGVITELSKQNGVVNATVIQFPLQKSGQPTYVSGSGGRFAAKFKASLDITELEQGAVLTLIGTVEELQNPYPDLRTTQLAIVQADDFFVWDGFSRADHPSVLDSAAFSKRGKWGWQVKSEKEKQRERQERNNQQNIRN